MGAEPESRNGGRLSVSECTVGWGSGTSPDHKKESLTWAPRCALDGCHFRLRQRFPVVRWRSPRALDIGASTRSFHHHAQEGETNAARDQHSRRILADDLLRFHLGSAIRVYD
jgi:hypothetical protein